MDYLRDLGALDASRPAVVVSNYLLGASNCIGTSRFYAQCCVDPCDQLVETWEMENLGWKELVVLLFLSLSFLRFEVGVEFHSWSSW